MIPVWVIGNGGHAKVAIDAINVSGRYSLAGILSDDPDSRPVELGVRHAGPLVDEVLDRLDVRNAIIAIGDNSTRARISSLLRSNVEWTTVIHPSAVVASTVSIGRGVLVCAGSIIQPYAKIDDHAIINTAATVDHDTAIGPFAHIAPGAHLAGNISVGEGVLIGVGASVIPGMTIGAHAVIGAGSVVISDISAYARVAGVPARPIGGS